MNDYEQTDNCRLTIWGFEKVLSYDEMPDGARHDKARGVIDYKQVDKTRSLKDNKQLYNGRSNMGI